MADQRGSDAIQNKLSSIYGPQETKHWGTIMRYSDGGPDPLDGVSAYKADNPPHWHYISFGLSELGEKKSSNLEESGWGIELSFRLRRAKQETEPPLWPVMALQNLARFVINNKTPFDDEHYIAWGRPITTHVDTRLVAMVFRIDPTLGQIDTPNGKLKFIEAIGITADEHQLVADKGVPALLPTLLKGNPLGVTDISR